MKPSFGDGTVFPYQMLVRPSDDARQFGCTPNSPSFFHDVNNLVGNTLGKVNNTKLTGFSGAAYIGVDTGVLLENPNVTAVLEEIGKLVPNWCGKSYVADIAERKPVINGLYNYSWAAWALEDGNCERIAGQNKELTSWTFPDPMIALLFEWFISDPRGLNADGLQCFSSTFDDLAAPCKAIPGAGASTPPCSTFKDEVSCTDRAPTVCEWSQGALGAAVLPFIATPMQQFCKATKLFNQKYVNNSEGLYLDIRLDIDPYSPTGVKWLHDARAAIANFSWDEDPYDDDDKGHTYYCPGGGDIYLASGITPWMAFSSNTPTPTLHTA